MTQFIEFREALRAWAFRLWDEMKLEVAQIRHQYLPQARMGGDTIGTIRPVPTDVWPERFNYDAFYFPEWISLRNAWLRDQELWKQHETLVGPAGFKASLGEHELGFAFWPTRRLVAHWRTDADPEHVRNEEFASIYDPIERFLSDASREFSYITPICGLVLERDIELDDGVAIVRFTREEMELLVDRGVIRGQFAGLITADNAEETRRHGLRRVLKTPKFCGGDFGAEELAEHARLLAQPEIDRLRILRTLGVCLDGKVLPQPYVGRLNGWHPGGGEQAAPSPLPAFVGYGLPAVALASHSSVSLGHIWKSVGDSRFEDSGSVRIAIDRLAWRGIRPNDVDLFVDAAIASESFFRSGEPRTFRQQKGREESIASRVNRRASEYIDGSDFAMAPADIREFFHQAYELRNGIVHRGEHPSVVTVGATAYTLSEFVARYVALVRRGIQRHLLGSDVPVAPSWDVLIPEQP